MNISHEPFGSVDGQNVELYTLENDDGLTVKITTYGGTVTSIVAPDKDGKASDIVCGFDTLDGYFSEEYKANSPYFGCLVGRYAARIKDGRFTVNGTEHQVATNDGPNHLHGGVKAFDKRVWSVVGTDQQPDAVSLTLSLKSEDGDESYPGNLQVQVEYKLTDNGELRIHYTGETDKATPLSLTNHTYFNLNGFEDNILDHCLQLSSDRYLEPDETNVPVGQETSVAGTLCDFNSPQRIGDAFEELPMGFEHYYAFSKPADKLDKVAEVIDPASGRKLEVFSSEPGTLFYTGRYTSDKLQRENGQKFGQFRAFCIETSKFPNGPNIDGAPRSVLQPGQKYDETTIYKLSCV